MSTQVTKDCADKFTAVENLRYALSPWSILRYGSGVLGIAVIIAIFCFCGILGILAWASN